MRMLYKDIKHRINRTNCIVIVKAPLEAAIRYDEEVFIIGITYTIDGGMDKYTVFIRPTVESSYSDKKKDYTYYESFMLQ